MNSSIASRLLCVFGAIGLAACATIPNPETKPMGVNVLSDAAIQTAN